MGAEPWLGGVGLKKAESGAEVTLLLLIFVQRTVGQRRREWRQVSRDTEDCGVPKKNNTDLGLSPTRSCVSTGRIH